MTHKIILIRNDALIHMFVFSHDLLKLRKNIFTCILIPQGFKADEQKQGIHRVLQSGFGPAIGRKRRKNTLHSLPDERPLQTGSDCFFRHLHNITVIANGVS